MQLNNQDTNTLQAILRNWKMTPATLATHILRQEWIPSPHLLYISARIAHAIHKGRGRVIITAPPRHGKSKLIDVATPIWFLERYPNLHVILASYGADLSEGFGREVRDTIRANQELLTCRVDPNSGRVDRFDMVDGGSMTSVGIGGAITGRGAHLLLIDDYVKEIKEALNMSYHEYVWNWYRTVARTRLEPNATIIIIATRWHSQDLIGRLQKEQPGVWEVIVLPAIAEKGDPLGRPQGAALFPERFPMDELLSVKEDMGSIWFEAMYQQHPIDETAVLTDQEWLKIVPQLPQDQFLRKARMWDLGATERGGDYTAGVLGAWDVKGRNFYIENIKRGQLSPRHVQELVRKTAMEDGGSVPIGFEQEPGSAGKGLIEFYQSSVLPEFDVFAVPTGKDSKLLRANPLIAASEAGRVWLVKAGWNQEFVSEFDSFPSGKHDDQVDAAAGAYNKLAGKRYLSATWGRKDEAPKAHPAGQSPLTLARKNRELTQRNMHETAKITVRKATFGRS